MTTETLHGMLERWGLEVKKRVDSLSDRSAGISYGYAACRENLGPLADQLQAVVDEMKQDWPALPKSGDLKEMFQWVTEVDMLSRQQTEKLQRILGTPGGTK